MAPTARSPRAVRTLGVALLGQGFMGRAHSRALAALRVLEEDPPAIPRLVSICGRDEASLEPQSYYRKLPPVQGSHVLVLDPMLATGGSGSAATAAVKDGGPRTSAFVCVVAAPEAIRKMTSLAAQQFGFAQRGLVKAGMAADLVVFDPATVVDKATYQHPHAFAAGIPHVLVNGVAVIRNGETTRARPGVPLTPQSEKRQSSEPAR